MPRRNIGGAEIQLRSFLALALDGNDNLHYPEALLPGMKPKPVEQEAG